MQRSSVRAAAALLAAAAQVAQAAPPPITPVAEPPARVGRLAALSGAVSFHTADQTAWSPALANLPVTSGDAVWTEPGARAALDVAGNRLWLDGRTLLELPTLDDHAVSANEPQGETYLHLRVVPPGDSYAVQTPRGLVQIEATGRYEVAAGDDGQPTRVTVLDGAARVTAPGLALDVGPNATATLTGAGTDADPVRGALGPAQRDAFLTAMLAEERTVPSHPVVSRMTGAEDLDRYGAWQDRPRYGAVWYPQVDPGWVPYRHGRWSWVAPWGWTWVDEAPWGFAPFHYGRWVQDDGRWGWAPAPAPEYVAQPAYVAEPVYAPALVSFFALGVLSAGLPERPVGWVPLGPNEPYYPPYRAGLPYIRNLNRGTVQNARTIINDNSVHTNIYNRTVVQTFVNRGGATVTPASAVVSSRPVAAAALPQAAVAPGLARAQAGFRPSFTPTAATLGATPLVAQQFHFAPAAPQAAPGPVIAPRAMPLGVAPVRPAAPGMPGGGVPRASGPSGAAAPQGAPGNATAPIQPGAGPNAPGPARAPEPAQAATPSRPNPGLEGTVGRRTENPGQPQPASGEARSPMAPAAERPVPPAPSNTQRDAPPGKVAGGGQGPAPRPAGAPLPAEPAEAAPAAPPRVGRGSAQHLEAGLPRSVPVGPRTPPPAPAGHQAAPAPRPQPVARPQFNAAPPPAPRPAPRPAMPSPRPAPPRPAPPPRPSPPHAAPAPHPAGGGGHPPNRHPH